jgi:hypothetical protein
MEHTSRPQPVVIARIFASLAPTMYLNMYSFGQHDNSRRTGLSASRFAVPQKPRLRTGVECRPIIDVRDVANQCVAAPTGVETERLFTAWPCMNIPVPAMVAKNADASNPIQR